MQPLSNTELVRLLDPWFPLFSRVGSAAMRDHLDGISIFGIPRKTERAGELHRAMRNHFRRVCDFAEPLFELKEEPEGDGLDYLVCRLDVERPFTLRWGRVNGGTINRNRTERTRIVYEQGTLFATLFGSPDDADDNHMPVVTLGYTVEDDYTEAGKPCWWMGRLLLLREQFQAMELVTEVHVYSPPDRSTVQEYTELAGPSVSAREEEWEQWAGLINEIRRRSA